MKQTKPICWMLEESRVVIILKNLSLISMFSELVVFFHKLEKSEAVVLGCSLKTVFLEIWQNSQENTCLSLFFNKIAGLKPATLLKKELWGQVFSCEICKISENTFFN